MHLFLSLRRFYIWGKTYKFEVSCVNMFLLMRLTSLSFCYSDGGDDIKDPEKELNTYQRTYRVKEMPTLF